MLYLIGGINIENLVFCHGTQGTPGTILRPNFFQAGIDGVSRKLFDAGKHPKKVVKEFEEDILASLTYWKRDDRDIFLSLCTDVMFNYVGMLVYEKVLSEKDVKVLLLNAENSSIICSCEYTEEGFLTSEWPFGFYNWSSSYES